MLKKNFIISMLLSSVAAMADFTVNAQLTPPPGYQFPGICQKFALNVSMPYKFPIIMDELTLTADYTVTKSFPPISQTEITPCLEINNSSYSTGYYYIYGGGGTILMLDQSKLDNTTVTINFKNLYKTPGSQYDSAVYADADGPAVVWMPTCMLRSTLINNVKKPQNDFPKE